MRIAKTEGSQIMENNAFLILICCLGFLAISDGYSADYLRRYYAYINRIRRQQETENQVYANVRNYRPNTSTGYTGSNSVVTGERVDDDDDNVDSRCRSLEFRQMSPTLQNEHHCLQLEGIQKEVEEENEAVGGMYRDVKKKLSKMEWQMHIARTDIYINEAMSILDETEIHLTKDFPIAKDCSILAKKGVTANGVYPLFTTAGKIMLASCDLQTEGGGWIVIQRREDGSTNFTRPWKDYKYGFGNPNSEHWLGNEYVHQMTRFRRFTLRIDMWDWNGRRGYAQYENFYLSSEKKNYALHYGSYRGNAGDSLSKHHNNSEFSTVDSDNDSWYASCAQKEQAGWWFKDCSFAALNGRYHKNGKIPIGPHGLEGGVLWFSWNNDYTYSLKKTEMKIRPMKWNTSN